MTRPARGWSSPSRCLPRSGWRASPGCTRSTTRRCSARRSASPDVRPTPRTCCRPCSSACCPGANTMGRRTAGGLLPARGRQRGGRPPAPPGGPCRDGLRRRGAACRGRAGAAAERAASARHRDARERRRDACSCCVTSRGCRIRSWPMCSSSRRTTSPSGSTGSGCGCRRRWSDRAQRSRGAKAPRISREGGTAMSEDRLDRALQEMKQEDRRCRDARRRARRVWNDADEHCRRRLCGVPARLPRVPERSRSPAAGACCWKTTSAAAPRAALRSPR